MTVEERAALAAPKPKKQRKSKDAVSAQVAKAQYDEPEVESEFWTMTLNGKDYIYDELNNCWELSSDGTKGDWAGTYDPSTKMIDDTAQEPTM